ncbi:MAG TPA: DUF739 domain-containing protein [Erysipelotrichaceae bacterium]|nr:DUF739 domain-containing protein [Erysipelotrichaceae bacterium]
MIYDFSKLKGRIVEKCGTQEDFAVKMGKSRASISSKLNNKATFSSDEIEKAKNILEITNDEIGMYFFTYKVQN